MIPRNIREVITFLLAASLLAVVLWFVITIALLYAPGNCYDNPEVCGLTHHEREGKS